MNQTTPADKSDNPAVFTITIPWAQVQTAYQSRLQEIAGTVTLDGFRPGNAPLPMVEEKVGKKRIFSDTIQKVLPPAYQAEIKNRNVAPMIAPRVKALTLDEGKDWQFEIAVVTKPSVDLGNLVEKLEAVLAPGKIVMPGKPEPASPAGGQTRDEKMRLAFDTLLATIRVDLPNLLIEEEVNFRLSQLVDQLQAIGMTVEQYLSSKQLTADTLRQSYEKTAREALTLNLALDKIATDQGFTEKDRIAKAVDWLLTR